MTAENYKKAYEREKKAREEAEFILETKIRELYLINQSLGQQNLRLTQSEAQLFKTVRALEETQTELEKLAHFDSLTNLSNRLQFETDLKREIARSSRYMRQLAMLYLDLDFFKKINDSFGHDVGDLLLKEVASRLRKNIRLEDYIARLGGDEFAIILTEIDDFHQVGKAAQRFIDEINKPFFIADYTILIGASIGISCYPDTGTEAIELHKNADIALYSAKSMGRNTYQFFTKELQSEHIHRLELEAELHFALERHELFLVYQPRFDLQSEKMVGIEVLLRWDHPNRGMISPSQFIPIAEDTGLIITIGEWLLQNAFKQFAIWRKQNPQLNCVLSINVSARQVQHKNFIQILASALEENNIPPELLELEVSETSILNFLGKNENSLGELRKMGVKFSIDDFGSNNDSFNRLKHSPIHSIKIDKSFVKDIDVKVNENLTLRSTIKAPKDLGLKVIAKGVETESQAQLLVKNHPEAQGFYYSEPLTAQQMEKFIYMSFR